MLFLLFAEYIQLNFHKSNATGVFLLKNKKYRPSKIKQGFPGGASGKELSQLDCAGENHNHLGKFIKKFTSLGCSLKILMK